MELVIIQFENVGRKCLMPLILNFANHQKRVEEDKIVNEIIKYLEKTDGVANVIKRGGGIDEYKNLNEAFNKVLDIKEVDHQQVRYLKIREKEFSEKQEFKYLDETYYLKVTYRDITSMPVRVINDKTSPEFIGDIPLPVVVIEKYSD
ncbi:hypothetical protein [Adhaeribacter rhizoryzae]|uniref:Uncharacterized protein n=1 Tax=Adhaeribacter rhizoryzae TaxID=2607907 RepID=A0A5M6DAJ9_9BACT|nr:hypothetical protein [Adhaeribacter rhizoryzae]KAA5543312.1 hypothetical protein F0145_16840 [Adhaeribacter rhizoryzae]